MKNIIFILMMLMVVTGCQNQDATTKLTVVHETGLNADALLLRKQSESITLSISFVDDLSGSYTLYPESRNMNLLIRFFSIHNGREILGYTTIQEDSYTPIIRWSHIPKTEEKATEKVSNPWIESEKEINTDFLVVNKTIDSLNNASYRFFIEKVEVKLKRPVAKRSDVVSALQRATVFLNEAPKSKKVMVVCSDFKDTNHRTMQFDSTIVLFIVGNVSAREVKLRTGLETGQYQVFESFEEAFTRIIQMNT